MLRDRSQATRWQRQDTRYSVGTQIQNDVRVPSKVPIIIFNFNKDVKKTHSIKSSSLLLRQLQEPLEVMAIASKKTTGASVPVHEYLMAVLPSAPAVEPGVDVQSGQGHSTFLLRLLL